ncbi:hypothetical protein [Acetobacter estunensis]|uniref:hypothetical protein n=1 Tax=Acetobacter estunensis TaxID=104097 RepID=UPI001C2D713F|nr:hypothetical protein [Acetobacter estunensis]MBV1836811.1 hypothetical protein [Acetobacter estunensis]
MLASRIIEIDGVFLGTMIKERSSTQFRFHAIHESVRALHARIIAEPTDLIRQAAVLLRRARSTVNARTMAQA